MLPMSERLTLPGSPFELLPAAANGHRHFRHAPLSLRQFWLSAGRFGSRPCMSFQGIDVSFHHVVSQAHGLESCLLRRNGVARGIRVAVIVDVPPAWLSSVVGIWLAGGVAVVLDHCLPTETLIKLMDLTDSHIVVCSRPIDVRLREQGDLRPHILATSLVDRAACDYFVASDSTIVGGATSPPEAMSEPDDDALITFTSGTTGAPKGVVSTHRAVLSGMLSTLLSAALTRTRVQQASPAGTTNRSPPCSLLMTPLFSIGGLIHLLTMAYAAGKVIPNIWRPEQLPLAVATGKITALVGMPTADLVELLRQEKQFGSLRGVSGISVYGSSVDPAHLMEIQARLPEAWVTSGYGLSESNGSISSASLHEMLSRQGTCGPIVPCADVSIRNCDATGVANGLSGEIWIRGPMLMRSYVSTRLTAIDLPNGWLNTHDIGALRSDGFLYIAERQHGTFIVDGVCHSCGEIETGLRKQGLARDAIAVISDTPEGPVRLTVAVVASGDDIPARLVEDWLSAETALPQAQITVRLIDRIPVTSSGKPDRNAFRRLAVFPDYDTRVSA